MNLRAKAIQIARSNALGSFAMKSARQTLETIDQIAHPSIPADRQIAKVKSNGKTFDILHRRTDADRHVIYQCFAEDQYDVTLALTLSTLIASIGGLLPRAASR